MTNLFDIGLWALAALVVWGVLAPNLWRALLVIRPSWIGLLPEDPPAGLPEELQPLAHQLAALGFTPLGSHLERPPLGPTVRLFDFVHPQLSTFASVYATRAGPRLFFLTRFADGGCALTSNYRRPATRVPGRYLSAHYESWPLARLFRAHQRMVAAHPAERATDMASRIAAARHWFHSVGADEIRQMNFPGLLWTLGTLGMVAAALWTRVR